MNMTGDDNILNQEHRRLPRPKKRKAQRVIDIRGITAVAPPESQVRCSSKYVESQQEGGQNNAPVYTTNSVEIETASVEATSNPLADDGTQLEHTKQWHDDVDIRDLEDWVMEELDRMVCRSEEQEVMKQLDVLIIKQEEQDVMQQLLQVVHESEDREYAESLPSRVQNLRRDPPNGQRVEEEDDAEARKAWDSVRRMRKRQREDIPVTQETGTTPSRPDSKLNGKPEIRHLVTLRQKLPKWVPRDFRGSRDRLATRKDYWLKVVRPLLELPEFQGIPDLHVVLTDQCDEDPDSCVLEANGTKEQIEKLRLCTERSIRAMIFDINVEKLWNDDYSLYLSVSINCEQKLGIFFIDATYRGRSDNQQASPGVWVHNIKKDCAVFQAFGSASVFESGCMIVAVDKEFVYMPLDIQRLLLKAQKASRSNVRLTFCFSRFADLSQLSSPLLQSLKYRDKNPYNAKIHEAFNEMRKVAIRLPHDPNSDQPREEARGTERDAIREEEDGVVPLSSSDNVENVTSAALARYDKFEQKYRPLVSLEFKNTKIHQKKIFSSMWNTHKIMFGEEAECDDDCKCYKSVSNMVSAAVMENASFCKDTSNELRKQTTGIMEHFMPRFVDRLKKEYPKESLLNLHQRLIQMWSQHQSSRLYGVQCGESCQCGGEWDQLFGMGDRSRSETFNASLRKKTRRLNRGKTQTPMLSSYDASRSQIPTSNRSTSNSSADAPPALGKRLERKRKNLHSTGTRPVHRSHSQSAEINNARFETVFDSAKPLGGYFVTKAGVDGIVGCHLFSKFAFGAIAKDSRIRLGSTVAAVILGERSREIRSHVDLETQYQQAKQMKRRLNIIFDNRGGLHGLSDTMENWSICGNWIGQRHGGWPGGAKVDFDKSRQAGKQPDLISPPNHPHSHLLQSCIPNLGSPVADAVQSPSCLDLIQVLERGYPKDRNEVETHLLPQYEYVQRELSRLKASLANGEDGDASILYKIQDWKAKYIILKICIRSIFEIEKAISLKGWNVIEIRVENVRFEQTSPLLLANKTISTKIKTSNPDSLLGTLPTMRFSPQISFGKESTIFQVHNNVLFTSETRLLVVDVEASPNQGDVIPIRLASFVFTLNELEKLFSSNSDWISSTKSLSTVGSVEISARRFNADKPYVFQKKDESIQGIKKQIETIESFNKDTELPAYAKLSANGRGIGGISLLHAAIELVDTSKLIEKLLSLQADPQASSSIGTPMDLAEKLCTRSHRKLEEAKDSGKPKDVVEAHRERYIKAWKIRDLLQKSRPNKVNASTNELHVKRTQHDRHVTWAE